MINNTKKSLIAMAVGVTLCTTGTASAVVGDYTGSFIFIDSSGVVQNTTTTVYGLDADPGGLTQAFIQGGFDFAAQTGKFTDDTLFQGVQWVTDVDTMFFYDPVAGGTQSFTYNWRNKQIFDGATVINCRTGVTIDGCAGITGTVLVDNPGVGYSFNLTAEGQYALALFFDWSINDDIPVLTAHQISNYNSTANTITIDQSLDVGDANGFPGTAMATAPFPDQTPTFSGTIETVPQASLAPVITAQASTPSINDNETYTITTADVTVVSSSSFPANLYSPNVTIQAQDGTDYTRSGNTITPTIEPAVSAVLTVPVTVTDSQFGESAVFNLSITVTAAADAPVIADKNPPTAASVGALYTYDAVATDPDGDVITYSLAFDGGTAADLPLWLSFTGSVLSGTPGLTDGGTAVSNIVITATDDSPSALTDSVGPFSINVSAVANTPPTISGTPPGSVDQDALYDFTPTLFDPDVGDTLTVTFTNLPTWITTADSSTGQISGTPTNDDVGVYTGIVITVTDSFGASASLAAFDITVNNINDAPTISGTPDTLVNSGDPYSFTPTANDIDGDGLAFSISGQPSWTTFDPLSGQLSGTPTDLNAGTHPNIIITVTDDSSDPPGVLSASLPAFSIDVNRLPIASNSVFSTPVNTATSGTVTASDPDGDSLIYTLVSETDGTTVLDMNTGDFTFTPSTDFEGSANFEFKVNDGNADSANATVTIFVGTSSVVRYEASNFTMLDETGANANGGANNVAATWNGVITTNVADTNFNNMTIASTTPFFGSLWSAHHIRVFGPGTYSFDTTCTLAQLEAGTSACNNPLESGQTEQFLTMTVGPDQIGVHILFDWSVNANIDVVNVYDINAEFTTDPALGGELWTGPGYGPYPWSGPPATDTKWRLASTDNDGDGIAGVSMVDGAFIGFNANFNLDIAQSDSNFTMLDETGANANGGANDVAATWNGVTTTDVADNNFSNMTIASTTPFFGSLWSAHHIRVFGPGTYSFDTTCTVAQLEAGTSACNNPLETGQTEQFLTMTVGPDQIGVHILFDWSVNANIDVVNVYEINAEFTTDSTLGGELWTGPGYGPYPWSGPPATDTKWRLASTDNDGDGIAGVSMVDGAFIGFNANFNLFVASGDVVIPAPEPHQVDIGPDTEVGKLESFIAGLSWPYVAIMFSWLWLVRRRFIKRQ